MDKTNAFRAKNCAGPVSWDADLAAKAKVTAEHNRDIGTLEHDKVRPGYGQNLAYTNMGYGGNPYINAEQLWEDEKPAWDATCMFSENTGHYTQTVWKGTTHVGCATAVGKDGRTYIACDYSPAGNVSGQYDSQVGCQTCRK